MILSNWRKNEMNKRKHIYIYQFIKFGEVVDEGFLDELSKKYYISQSAIRDRYIRGKTFNGMNIERKTTKC